VNHTNLLEKERGGKEREKVSKKEREQRGKREWQET
jgi:hypothetical protein